ncbi:MFS transporter [Arthrobacter sp. UM1]|uniref:MFS transporter n=1 Tax=Arthrobacter sp. UM1 TaxID=2766776 RepID=UPI001CF6C23B|nr:MFS transporter [Arthrobacter sp. UM1]
MAIATASQPTIELDQHQEISKKSLVIAGMSTVIEWYDFTLYLYLTTILSRVIFAGGNGGTAATLLVFAATYLLRPVGAAVFGGIGDKYGRRPVLLVSMGLMTLAMLGTALLPTHAQAGALSGWLMLALRCLMSFSVGGEYSGVITYLVEGAAPKRRGFITSLASASSEIGGLLAVAISSLTTTFVHGPDLDSWGWRIPFFVGALLAGATLFARSGLEESPVFENEVKEDAVPKGSPLLLLLRTEPMALLRTFAISAVGSITYYVGIGYAPTFLSSAGKFSESDSLWLGTAAAVAVIAVTPIAGKLSDKWGRKPVLLVAGVAAAALSLTMFQIMAAGSPGLALTGALVLAAVAGVWSSVAASTVAEQFTSRARMSGMALGYTAATAIFGGFAPLVAEQVVSATHWDPAPGLMIAVVAAVVLPIVWFQPETAPRAVVRKLSKIKGPGPREDS